MGYYCFVGQNVSNFIVYICILGYYCLVGSFLEVFCFLGFYQNEVGQVRNLRKLCDVYFVDIISVEKQILMCSIYF